MSRCRRTGHAAGRSPIKKTAISASMILLGCILLTTGFKRQIGPNIDAVSQLKARGIIGAVISQTIKEEFSGREYEENLFKVTKGSDGKVQMVQANTRLINELVAGFTASLQKKYSEAEPQTIRVPYGTIIGSRILSQTDLGVDIKVLPLSVTSCDFETEFEGQGINQTKYKIYIVIESNVRVLQPFSSKNFKTRSRMLISEIVIVGDVPDSYVYVPEEDILDVT
ncbi:MAG: sporulation protein YunB [Emergencia sp.]